MKKSFIIILSVAVFLIGTAAVLKIVKGKSKIKHEGKNRKGNGKKWVSN